MITMYKFGRKMLRKLYRLTQNQLKMLIWDISVSVLFLKLILDDTTRYNKSRSRNQNSYADALIQLSQKDETVHSFLAPDLYSDVNFSEKKCKVIPV